MTPGPSHDDIRSLLGAYAVHAVEEDERALVEAHLVTCQECATEVDALVETAALLGMAEHEEPSPALWSRILTEISPASPASFSGPAAEPEPSRAPRSLREVAPVIALDAAREARRERRSRVRLAIGSAAAAIALAVPVTAAIVGGSSAPSLAALAEQARGRSDSRAVELVATDGHRVGEVILTGSGVGYLRPDGLDPLPAGRTYQLWAVIDGVPVSAGLLGADPEVSTFTVNGDVVAMAVSVEDAKGASAPSAAPVASAQLA